MTRIVSTLIHGSIVDDDTEMTLVELCQACSVHEDDVRVWVSEGVLHPSDEPGHPTRAQRRGLRSELGRGGGILGRIRAWWALPPR